MASGRIWDHGLRISFEGTVNLTSDGGTNYGLAFSSSAILRIPRLLGWRLKPLADSVPKRSLVSDSMADVSLTSDPA